MEKCESGHTGLAFAALWFLRRDGAKKVLAIYDPRFIFTAVFVAGRWSAHPGNDGIAG
jgi:hypothetical protein